MALELFYLILVISSSSMGIVLAEEETGDEQADAASVNPKFTSVVGEHTVMVSNTATLPCRVADIAESDATVAWYRVGPTAESQSNDNVEETGQQLFLDRTRIIDDHRFQLVEGSDNIYDLNIAEVSPYDSGPYECRISTTPPLVQQQILKVMVPPHVNIIPDTNPYTVEPGQIITLTCDASGFPQSDVVWIREGGPLPDGAASIKGKGHARLVYENANVSHSGVYRCTADNGVGNAAVASISIDVVSKDTAKNAPTVQTERKFVPVNEGQNVSVSCNYSANPLPLVHWLYNNFVVNSQSHKNRERISIVHHQPTPGQALWTSTLTIANIQESDFGEYICRVENNLGQEEKIILVSGKPGPPYDFTATTYGDRIDLKWRLESAPDILGYKLFYRKPKEDFSLSTDVPASVGRRVKGNEWEALYSWRYDATSTPLLSPDTEYQLAIQGVNVFGDGFLPSPLLDVKTPAKFEGMQEKPMEKLPEKAKETKDYGAQHAKPVKAGSGRNAAVASHGCGRISVIFVVAPLVLAFVLRSLA